MKTEQKIPKYLSWRKLNEVISLMTEKELVDRIEYELHNERRVTVVERLHQRFTTVRASRERMELFAELSK